jgi:hypothetical protein
MRRGAELCTRVHGHDRTGELRDAIAFGTAAVVERPGRISGYATGFGYGWHAVAETNEDLMALLGSAEAFMGLGILVPSRNADRSGRICPRSCSERYVNCATRLAHDIKRPGAPIP